MGLLKSIARGRRAAGEDRTDTSTPHEPNVGVLLCVDEARNAIEARRYADALALLGANEGYDVEATLLRGRTLLALGRYAEAARALERAASATPPDAATLSALAWAAEWRDDVSTARERWDRVLEVDRDGGASLLGRARAALRSGDREGALWRAEAAAARPGSEIGGTLLIAAILRINKRAEAAEATLRRAIAAHPDSGELMEELAVLLSSQRRDMEAIEWLGLARDATSDERHRVAIAVNEAIGMRRTGREREGLDATLRILATAPVLNGHLEIGTALLSYGVFDEGWRQYEHRWFVPPLAEHRADFGVPHWAGQPLEGRTILVRCEQGFGDTFQFARYLPMLKARGALVLLLPVQGLQRFCRRLDGVDHVMDLGEEFPPLDYYANLLSLPLAFGTTLDSIPANTPYLTADEALSPRWSTRLASANKPLVGIVWAGRPDHANDRRRSLSLDALAPLLSVEGIRFVSLQKGAAVEQGESVPESVDWDPSGPELDDFEDTAAVLANLDLLICVDTAAAHLAGGMGKEVWVLLPSPAEFRWLHDRSDTPWYPTMRLFRQTQPGAWSDVLDRVAIELRQWRNERLFLRSPTLMVDAPSRGSIEPIVVPPSIARAFETRAGLMQYFPDEHVGRSLEYYGEWLEAALEFVRPLLLRDGTVLESGAGVGAHTLRIAKALGPRGAVLAFERDPRHRSALEINLGAHGLRQVTVLPEVLGAVASNAGAQTTVDALCVETLDGILVQDEADASGLLIGAQQTLWRCRPWVVVLSKDESRLSAAYDALRDCGYESWRSRILWFQRSNFNRRDDDVFGSRTTAMLLALPEEHGFEATPPGLERWS